MNAERGQGDLGGDMPARCLHGSPVCTLCTAAWSPAARAAQPSDCPAKPPQTLQPPLVLSHCPGNPRTRAPPTLPMLPAHSPLPFCREELKRRFPTKPWVDVLSKADLLEEEFDEADTVLAAGGLGAGPQPAPERAPASPEVGQQQEPRGMQGQGHGEGEEELAAEQQQRHTLQPAAAQQQVAAAAADARAAHQQAAQPPAHQQQLQQPQRLGSAVQFAAALPHALRVSSTSGDGVDELKLAMLAMLEQHYAQLQAGEGWQLQPELQVQQGASTEVLGFDDV